MLVASIWNSILYIHFVSSLFIFKRPNNVTSSTKCSYWPLLSHNALCDFLVALVMSFLSLSVGFASPLLLSTVGLDRWPAPVLLDVSGGVFAGAQFALDWFKWRDFNEVATYGSEGRRERANKDREHSRSGDKGKATLLPGQGQTGGGAEWEHGRGVPPAGALPSSVGPGAPEGGGGIETLRPLLPWGDVWVSSPRRPTPQADELTAGNGADRE